eukprot:TRINITY_DN6611_c0_g1_i1.p1 TRINITY_DN6611_c0_g1~~TRINITY_DN6611_c0_g1_i1.p1  ORF type:complete len:504 (-),score=112.96 TRINITY_DN6611_c0_g1_i1:366-1727(-)
MPDAADPVADESRLDEPKLFNIEPEHELRVEVDFNANMSLILKQGTAEIFGTELALDKPYKFTGTKFAVFTWHGCILEITGNCHSYVANETPMVSYLNTFAVIEERRTVAKITGANGPRVVLVGATDTGKSTVSRILLNYSARRGNQPIYVDLDIGQGAITIPGMLAAIHVNKPVDIQDGFSMMAPNVYYFGHASLNDNVRLFKSQMSKMTQDIERACEYSPEVKSSGLIINTCGWIDGLGYELLLHSIEELKADIVLVLDNERLYSDLLREFNKAKPVAYGETASTKRQIDVVKLGKSGGVVTRNVAFRRQTRMTKIREYFYGPTDNMSPHSMVLDFRNVTIYRVGSGVQAPASALPIGATSAIDPLRLSVVDPSTELQFAVLAVSHSQRDPPASDEDVTSLEDHSIVECNLAGFLYVTEVNMDRNKFTVLCPCPGPLPSGNLILGSIKWLE